MAISTEMWADNRSRMPPWRIGLPLADDAAADVVTDYLNQSNISHQGPTVELTNEILAEAGHSSKRLGYLATDHEAGGAGEDRLKDGELWTNGNQIDIAYLDLKSHSAFLFTAGNSMALRDLIFGFDGDDEIRSGFGSRDELYSIERIVGTSFVDTINVATQFLPENIDLTIDSGGGKDKIDLSASASGVTVNIGADGSGTIKAASGAGGEVKLVNFNTEIKGSNFDDVLQDLAGSDHVIDGGAGDDVIRSRGILAEVRGGAGNDDIQTEGAGTVILSGTGEGKIRLSHNALLADANGRTAFSSMIARCLAAKNRPSMKAPGRGGTGRWSIPTSKSGDASLRLHVQIWA